MLLTIIFLVIMHNVDKFPKDTELYRYNIGKTE